jgi:hypothetical protein
MWTSGEPLKTNFGTWVFALRQHVFGKQGITMLYKPSNTQKHDAVLYYTFVPQKQVDNDSFFLKLRKRIRDDGITNRAVMFLMLGTKKVTAKQHKLDSSTPVFTLLLFNDPKLSANVYEADNTEEGVVQRDEIIAALKLLYQRRNALTNAPCCDAIACNKPAEVVCGGCLVTHYCGTECASRDWFNGFHSTKCTGTGEHHSD